MRIFLLLFIAMPVIELWLLITVGRQIGAAATIALVLLTAIVGVALLRYQGLRTLFRGQARLSRGELPAQEMIEGMILAFCGALLLTPGFITDVVGFLGLLPAMRGRLAGALLQRGMVQRGGSFFHFQAGGRPPSPERGRRDHGEDSIEGEYWRDEDKKPIDRDQRP